MGLEHGLRPPRPKVCKIILDKSWQLMYNNIMNLVAEHMGDLFLVLMLLFGFVLVIYVNADYLPDKERKDYDDWF